MTRRWTMEHASSPPWPLGSSVLRKPAANSGSRLANKPASWTVRRAAEGIEELIDDLFHDAFVIWVAKSLVRKTDEEPCCAVVFYGCCLEVLDSLPDDTPLCVQWESGQPSREMLAGREHPKSFVKPDMTLTCGHRCTIKIEAKRLMPGQGLPKKYVQEGMRRFIDGKYSSTSGKPGYMLGFVVDGETNRVVLAINKAIEAQPDLGTSHQLGSATAPLPRFARYESTHVDGLRLVHNLLDVRLPVLSSSVRNVDHTSP
jgi:hypothetical protein